MHSVATHAALAAQWHPTRNGALTPQGVPHYSPTPVRWRCPAGADHVWRASPANRRRGSGCPFCANKRVSITNSLAARRPDLAAQWHPTKNGALRPGDVVTGANRKVWWRCPAARAHVWEATVASRAGARATGCPFCAGRRVAADNALATVRPDVAALWHPTKNGALRPDDVTAGSSRVVWWQCPEGADHVWRSPVSERATYGCPFCRGLKTPASGSLAARHPDLAAQWHPTKNAPLRPQDVVPGSNRRVWWQCPRAAAHAWQATVAQRARRGSGCPYCSGRRVQRGDPVTLAVKVPDVARQWHPTKNGALRPDDVLAGSRRAVWWRCPAGADHVWRATPAHRTTRGQGCPFCAGQRASVTNALATVAPALAAEWHPTKNGALTPRDVTAGSHRVVVWRCRTDPRHVWSSSVHARHAGSASAPAGHGCPYCANRIATAETSLAAREPVLAEQWHPTKNAPLRPEDVVPGSNRAVWWKCPEGPDHVWRTKIAERVNDSLGCPFCSRRRLSVTNSLAAVAPRLARQWHPTRNGARGPDAVRVNSRERAVWTCPRGPDHVWETPIFHRALLGQGCPFCAGRRLSITNCFATKHPRLAAQWHPTRNGRLRPQDVFASAARYVWWRCEVGHVWPCRLDVRVKKQSGCPTCYQQRGRTHRPATTRKVREVVRFPSRCR